MSVSQITPTLFLSGADAALNKALLSRRGITLIINVTVELPCAEHQGVECLRVPVSDRPHAQLGEHFESMADCIRGNRTGSTLVHCAAGMSRSPALVMAYLMRYEGVTLRQAHDWVRDCRPHIRPNAGFWRQLLDYEKKLYGKNTVKMIATPLGVLPESNISEGDPECCLSW
ncbi:dual specificity protein phosphatase 14-like [Megalops cyprinoides]|uniref:dual specificity protein phosphatase 14-like n=1 Tax=Megalops cyprinoides TaxID=118141 RepID=UPI0018654135|nr:dual specificity protein phosphatase 14-like [Megalops cyprinoides]XP_036392800.1 dual specificity protein phosphatase 14-like [Megalops cyprinoides]